MTSPYAVSYRKIVGLVVLFLILGQIMLFSATGILGLAKYGSEFYFVSRQFISAMLGLGLMYLLSRTRYQLWLKMVYPAMGILIVCLLATRFSPFAHHAQGATRWLRIGGFQFQPSELAKIVVPMFVAALLSRRETTGLLRKAWIVNILILMATLLLIFKQPDLGSTVLLSAITVTLFFLAGAKLTYLLGAGAIGLSLTLLATLHSDYRRKRLFGFLNPWADPQGSGFQAIQSFVSIHSGSLLGVGIGNGNSKLFYLPEVHTDFIFALIGEELGFVGAIAVLAAFAYFGYLLFKAAFHAPDAFGRYLGFGLAMGLLLQLVVNLGGVTGLIPVKGLPLPFISWGRSALLANLASVGILLNIVRQSVVSSPPATTKMSPEKKKS